MKTEMEYLTSAKLAMNDAKLSILLEAFGEHLAQQQGLKDVRGMDAIHLYLMNKYHWQLSYLRTLNNKYLEDVLTQEMQGWSLAKDHPAQTALKMF